MRVPTTMGLALFNASAKSKGNWVAKQVMERAEYTQQGTKAMPEINVRVSNRTRAKIAAQQGVKV